MKTIGILIIALTATLIADGWAFDVDGFRSGMSRQDAEEALVKWNFDKIDLKEDSILAYDKPGKSSERFYIFSFEKGRLITLQKDFKPNVKNLILLFDKLSKDCPNLVSSGAGSDISTAGETKYISFKWRCEKESVELAYYIYENNDQLCVRYYTKSEF